MAVARIGVIAHLLPAHAFSTTFNRKCFQKYLSVCSGYVSVRSITQRSNVEELMPKSSEANKQTSSDLSKSYVSKADKNKVGRILDRLSDFIGTYKTEDHTSNVASFEADERFNKIARQLETEISTMTAAQVLTSLSLLLPLCSIEQFVIKSLENRLLWLMPRMSVAQLVQILQIYGNVKGSSTIQNQVLVWIQKRWVELTKGKDIVYLLHFAPSDATELLVRLESRALDACGDMSAKELYRTLYVLARRHRRNTPLIRAVVYHLGQMETWPFSPVHLANLVFALSTLNISNKVLMDKVARNAVSFTLLEQQTEHIIPTLASIVHSFGLLRWNDSKLLDVCVEFFQKHEHMVTPASWHQLLFATAWIGYVPGVLSVVGLHKLSDSPFYKNRPELLDYVWSCAVFSLINNDIVSKVLNPEYVTAVTGSCRENVVPVYTKLLAINAVAQSVLKKYNGPLLSKEFTTTAVNQLLQARCRDGIFSSVLKALSQMAPHDNYYRTDVPTSSGQIIANSWRMVADCVGNSIGARPVTCDDLRFVLKVVLLIRFTKCLSTKNVDIKVMLNNSGDLRPFSMQEVMQIGDGDVKLQLRRVAIQILNYSDMTGGVVAPNGSSKLTAELLTKQGYTVIQIPYHEFSVNDSVVKQVQYLHRKFKDAVLPTPLTGAGIISTTELATGTNADDAKSAVEMEQRLDKISAETSAKGRVKKSPATALGRSPRSLESQDSSLDSSHSQGRKKAEVKIDVSSFFSDK